MVYEGRSRVLGFRDWAFGFRESGSGFRVTSFGFRESGFGLQVSGCGLRASMFRVSSNADPGRATQVAAMVYEGRESFSHVLGTLSTPPSIQGYLAHKKQRPPRTLQEAYA